MKSRICILLCIGLWLVPLEARAARWGEAMGIFNIVSPHDSVNVSRVESSFRGLPWWRRRTDHSTDFGASRLESRWRAGAANRVRSEATSGVGPIVDQALYGADGNVLGMARSANTLYIAGSFRSVGESSGGYVAVDPRTGATLGRFPKVAGSVAVIVPDGSGGWYLGGDFTAVAGKPRSCLAHVLVDGSVSDWNPSATGSPGYIDPPVVVAIAIRDGRLFVGGAFRMIDGQPHENLGCVDLRSGAVLDWNLSTNVDEPVSSFVVHGDTLFVAGHFSSLGGVPRRSLAAVSATTGAVLQWQMDLYGGANTLLASGDTLYVGGDFTEIAGWKSSKLAAASINTALPLPIDFRVNGVYRQYYPGIQVDGLAKVGDTLYVVGNFNQIGGRIRSGIAGLNATNGEALAWAPDTTGPRFDGDPPDLCTSVAIASGTLYVGGYFEYAGGAYHPYAAAWDRQTGRVLDWSPTPDDVVAAFAPHGDKLYLGGYFQLVGGWQHRAGLAALDLATGRLKPWNPNPNGIICTAIAVKGDHVFVSGDFSMIGGDPQPRSYFAALDTTTGGVTSWGPGADDLATVLILAGDTLYAGGMFTQVGGLSRNRVAAIDANTGQVLPWDPSANSVVYAMARSGDTIYLGGTFTQVGGQQRLGLAAVDAYTGVLSPWNPGTDNSTVYTVLVGDRVLYAGGAFGVIGGQPQKALAAVDLRTGQPTAWRPVLTEWDVVDPRVRALALVDSVLYVGGSFASVGGQPRVCLGSVSTTTGLASDWNPGTDGLVWSLAASGNTLYAGGGFSRAGGIPADGLVAFSFVPPALSLPATLELSQCVPNPVWADAEVRFGLPRAATVTLTVYDLQGRRVAVPLARSILSAGRHVVTVQTTNWRPGMYLYRLDADGRSAARKMLVLR